MRVLCPLVLAVAAAAAHADPQNVEEATGVLDFNVAARTPGPDDSGGFPGALDIDGDGQVSRAEAAGNAEVTLGFDRADRNRNGKVSRAEWERYEKWQERRAKARAARLARAKQKEPAAAGGTAAKSRSRSAP
jgi:hypothetical protein